MENCYENDDFYCKNGHLLHKQSTPQLDFAGVSEADCLDVQAVNAALNGPVPCQFKGDIGVSASKWWRALVLELGALNRHLACFILLLCNISVSSLSLLCSPVFMSLHSKNDVTANCKMVGHFSIENHGFSGAILP